MIVEVPAHEFVPRRVLITRRILIWTPVIAVLALLVGRLFDRPSYDSKTVPESLVGHWACDLPEYSDRFLTLTATSITFGIGGSSFVKYTILGIEEAQVEGVDTIILHFRDVSGTKFKRRVVVDPSGVRMHFASQPAVVWQRYGS